jgi:prevent-host-death family protein
VKNHQIGLFEAKTKLSQLCANVAETGESVTITRRGKPIVVVNPLPEPTLSILDRMAAYHATYGELESKEPEFELLPRSAELDTFEFED